MKATFGELGGTYKQVGDYLLPDVEVPENPEIGFWGMLSFLVLSTIMKWKIYSVQKKCVSFIINNSYLYICADNVKI